MLGKLLNGLIERAADQWLHSDKAKRYAASAVLRWGQLGMMALLAWALKSHFGGLDDSGAKVIGAEWTHFLEVAAPVAGAALIELASYARAKLNAKALEVAVEAPANALTPATAKEVAKVELAAKVGVLLLCAGLVAAPVSAQTVTLRTVGTSGTITANGGAVTLSDTGGMTSLLIQTTGTFSLTWEAQCAGDGTTFDTDDEIPVTLVSSAPTAADSVVGGVNGLYTATIAGCRAVRVTATAYTSGTMTVSLTATPTGGGSSGGGGAAGAVTNAGTFAVQCTAGCSGSTFADNAAFTFGTTAIAAIGGVFDDVATNTATENSAAVARITTNKALHTNPRDAAGTELFGTATASADATANPTLGGFRSFVHVWNGATWDRLAGAATTGLVANTEMPAAAALADDTANPTVPGVAAFMMCYDGTTWDRCQTTRDPCAGAAKTLIPFSITSGTTTEITPSLAGASTHYYVCSLAMMTGVANNVALADDDSDGCGSVTSGMAGGTTATNGFNLAANGGIVMGDGNATIAKTNGTNRVVCLVTSSAGPLAGTMGVVAAP